MKRAYPVNAKGIQDGPVRSFTDLAWEKISKMKECRWRIVDENYKPAIEVIDIISEPYKEVVSTIKAKSKNKPKSKPRE